MVNLVIAKELSLQLAMYNAVVRLFAYETYQQDLLLR